MTSTAERRGAEPERRGAELLARVRRGEMTATGQLITSFEAGTAVAVAARGAVHAAGGRAHIVGVTGPPGTGKSTLVASLARELRIRGLTIGIVAVDPSSSLSHGALLGDRIRMCDHGLDPGVFVRSMSSRGSLGGVARATVDAVAILDAGGWDVVVVETVGVGQAEVEIVQIAHTTVVVSVPGLGDDIQALKAGLLEIADLHVVNKLDRPDANRTIAELLAMLALTDPARGMEWAVPVLGTNALNGDGVPELADSLAGHREWLRTSGELAHRERVMAAARVRAVAKDLTIERIDHAIDVEINELLDAVVARRMDPHAAAASLIDRVSVTS